MTIEWAISLQSLKFKNTITINFISAFKRNVKVYIDRHNIKSKIIILYIGGTIVRDLLVYSGDDVTDRRCIHKTKT